MRIADKTEPLRAFGAHTKAPPVGLNDPLSAAHAGRPEAAAGFEDEEREVLAGEERGLTGNHSHAIADAAAVNPDFDDRAVLAAEGLGHLDDGTGMDARLAGRALGVHVDVFDPPDDDEVARTGEVLDRHVDERGGRSRRRYSCEGGSEQGESDTHARRVAGS